MKKFITVGISTAVITIASTIAFTHTASASIDAQQGEMADLRTCLKQSQPTQIPQPTVSPANSLKVESQKFNLQCFFSMGGGEKNVDLKPFASIQPTTPPSSFILEYNAKNNRIGIPIFKVEF